MSRWKTACALGFMLLTATATAQQPPSAPAWHPLPAEQEKHLDAVLKYWEYQASKTQRYRCNFTRWEYDPVRLPRHPEVAATIAQGNIQFASPDKGLFKVEKLGQIKVEQQANLTVPVMTDGKPQYSAPSEILGEHWVCDGKFIYEFDSLNKQLKKRALPPEMQGQQISEGPLPFLFGAKAQTIKDRYWVRVVNPPPKPKHFWLEAIPKRREQAADFNAVHIIIDEQEFLPSALILYEKAGGRATYEFQNRERNWNMLPEMINPFAQQFFEPKLPAGWKLVVEPFQAVPPAGPVAQPLNPPIAPRQAQQAPIGPPRR